MLSADPNGKTLAVIAEYAILTAVLALFLFPGCNDGYSIYDEGVAVYGAERVMHGQMPYRDFWTMYAPGQYYLTAILFKLCGPSLMAERICTTVTLIVLCLLIYAILRQTVTRPFACVGMALTAIWLGGVKFFGSPMPTALALSMASALLFVRFLHTLRLRPLLISGVLAGASTLFRHDIGVYSFAAASMMVILLALKRRAESPNRAAEFPKSPWLLLAVLIGGYVLVVLPVAAYFSARAGYSNVVSDLIRFPSEVYPRVRSLPFPVLWSSGSGDHSLTESAGTLLSPTNPALSYYVPIVVYAVTAAAFLRQFRGKHSIASSSASSVRPYFLILGGLFFLQASVRSDIHHFIPTFLPAIILSALPLANFADRLTQGGRMAPWVLSILIVAGSGLSIQHSPLLYRLHLIGETVRGAQHSRLPGGRASAIRIDGDCSDYRKLIDFINDSVPPGDRIFVGNTRHDQILKNDALLYFLADRECAVRYHELHPGLATTTPVQQEIVDCLEKSGIRFVILCDIKGNEPNESSLSSGISLLDDYLGRSDPIIRQFGKYSVGRSDSAYCRQSDSADKNQLGLAGAANDF